MQEMVCVQSAGFVLTLSQISSPAVVVALVTAVPPRSCYRNSSGIIESNNSDYEDCLSDIPGVLLGNDSAVTEGSHPVYRFRNSRALIHYQVSLRIITDDSQRNLSDELFILFTLSNKKHL